MHFLHSLKLVTAFDLLYRYYVGHFPLTQVLMIAYTRRLNSWLQSDRQAIH
jgi:hypothetical protein